MVIDLCFSMFFVIVSISWGRSGFDWELPKKGCRDQGKERMMCESAEGVGVLKIVMAPRLMAWRGGRDDLRSLLENIFFEVHDILLFWMRRVQENYMTLSMKTIEIIPYVLSYLAIWAGQPGVLHCRKYVDGVGYVRNGLQLWRGQKSKKSALRAGGGR